MSGINNLKSDRVIRAFERAGWINKRIKGSHWYFMKEGNPNIVSIPIHKNKPIKKGLLLNELKKAGITVEEFLQLY
ncbi:MAG: type II toxin-antitoxin system HicA family toxin [Candidatus Magnetoovum sp. WYHC-5]|nr:type II toxin-antitoxin system HicA family toxin [Candidatus Magnetoovum sp. WYHC-5]